MAKTEGLATSAEAMEAYECRANEIYPDDAPAAHMWGNGMDETITPAQSPQPPRVMLGAQDLWPIHLGMTSAISMLIGAELQPTNAIVLAANQIEALLNNCQGNG